MKIDAIALSLIKSTKFCSLEDAVNYAKEYNTDSAWKFVVGRPDMTVEILLKYARKINLPNLWRHVVVYPELKPVDAIGLAVELGTQDIWKRVLGRDDVPFRRALPIALGMKEQLFYSNILEVVFAKSDIAPLRAIEVATDLNDYCAWSKLLRNETFLEYLNDMPISMLFTLASATDNNIEVFKLIVSRKETTVEELYDCLTLTGSNAILDLVVARPDFQKSIREITPSELIEKAKTIDWNLYWDVVLEREDIRTNAELAMSLIQLGNYHLTNNLLELTIAPQLIKDLSVESAVELLSLDSTSLREKIIERDDVLLYLKTCKKSVAIAIIMSCPHHYVRNLILQRSDFSIAEKVKHAREPYDYVQVCKTPVFANYFRRLKIDNAVSVAKKINLNDVYRLLLQRRALSFNEMMEIAKEVNTSGVWNMVLERNDVKKYYELE